MNDKVSALLNDQVNKELFGDDARSLYMLNSELAGRTYSAPSLVL